MFSMTDGFLICSLPPQTFCSSNSQLFSIIIPFSFLHSLPCFILFSFLSSFSPSLFHFLAPSSRACNFHFDLVIKKVAKNQQILYDWNKREQLFLQQLWAINQVKNCECAKIENCENLTGECHKKIVISGKGANRKTVSTALDLTVLPLLPLFFFFPLLKRMFNCSLLRHFFSLHKKEQRRLNDQKIERFKKHFIHGPLFLKGTTKKEKKGKGKSDKETVKWSRKFLWML